MSYYTDEGTEVERGNIYSGQATIYSITAWQLLKIFQRFFLFIVWESKVYESPSFFILSSLLYLKVLPDTSVFNPWWLVSTCVTILSPIDLIDVHRTKSNERFPSQLNGSQEMRVSGWAVLTGIGWFGHYRNI